MRQSETASQLEFDWLALDDYYLTLYRALEGKSEFISKIQEYPEFVQPSPANNKTADEFYLKAAWIRLTELKPKEAAKYLEGLSEEAHKESFFFFLSENIFMSTGDWQNLWKLGEQRIHRNPEDSRGWIIKGISLEKMGKIQEAYSLLLGVLPQFSKDFFDLIVVDE